MKETLLRYFRPSNASRVLNCTKSIIYEKDNRYDNSTIYSIRGNALHILAERQYRHKSFNPKYYVDIDTNQYYKYSNDDKNLVNNYLDYINNISTNTINKGVEQKIYLELLHNKLAFKSGTIDFYCYSDDTIDIVDLKTGNSFVSSNNNMQLSIYAYCLIKELNINPMFINLTIYQYNRAFTINTSLIELEDYIKELQIKLDEIDNNILSYNASKDTCKFCSNKNNCLEYSKLDK